MTADPGGPGVGVDASVAPRVPPLTMFGTADAVCVDGVCAVPDRPGGGPSSPADPPDEGPAGLGASS